MNILHLHSHCIGKGKKTNRCKKCIARSNFIPSCETCMFFSIPIQKICRECMFTEGGEHQLWEAIP